MSSLAGRLTLDEAAGQHWDVIVIGTGIGGATFGYAMARAGQQVLFCERGAAHLDQSGGGGTALTGHYPEEDLPNAIARHLAPDQQLLRQAGRATDLLDDVSGRKTRSFVPFVGSGTGGSSALYGMAMERFFPADFEPRGQHPGDSDNSLPAAWPLSYAELAPWYSQAEALYRVRGTVDPLRAGFDPPRTLPAPPALTPAADWLAQHLSATGLHPYRLPMACEFLPGCQGCQGYLCPKACKNDSARICLLPAVTEHGAQLLADCTVVKLEARQQQVTGVVCRQADGNLRTLRARTVALAAGAMQSSALLLRSASEAWPDGLANRSGLVGRNLMRHCIDLHALTLPNDARPLADENRQKQLAFNDFYAGTAGKLGSVQSFGRLPPQQMLFATLLDDVAHSPWAALLPLLRCAEPLLAPTLRQLAQESMILAATLEDLPNANNRVTLSPTQPDGLHLHYRMTTGQRQRVATLRKLIAARLRPLPVRLLKQADNNQRLAHVCGTLRFGNSAANSVLNLNNRAHGLDNLFAVDASFFPSSGGTNPSLTIAANAMRVANHLNT